MRRGTVDTRQIKTEDDYDRALVEIERLMGVPLDTPEGNKLEVLVALVEAYEETHWPIDDSAGDREP